MTPTDRAGLVAEPNAYAELRPKGWLKRQIDEAAAEVASWPEWMQRAAHFEGTPRRTDDD